MHVVELIGIYAVHRTITRTETRRVQDDAYAGSIEREKIVGIVDSVAGIVQVAEIDEYRGCR